MARRALIVEDEFLIAIGLEITLRELGFDVCGLASNPTEAIELATSRRPDLILMDVYLEGGCQGIKAAKWLQDACEIPILFVTGAVDQDTIANIRALLPKAFVCAKPVARDRLAKAITSATRSKPASMPAHFKH